MPRLAPLLLVVATACAPAPEPVRLEDWLRVGVDPSEEARAVEAQLVAGGFVVEARVEQDERFVALGFARADGRRAVRLVSRRGVVASLDSHEPDGVRMRHGAVRLVAPATEDLDVDGDGQPEVVVAREEDGATCLALIRIEEDGRAVAVPDDADELAPGACVDGLEDVDGDGAREAMVTLAWPELALDEGAAPSVRAALVAFEGGYRARGVPAVRLAAERERRARGLEAARARLDVAEALRVAVELAALAHLDGASLAAQVERFDAALRGLVLSERELAAVRRARATIAAGWRPEDGRDTPGPRSDGQQEEEDPG